MSYTSFIRAVVDAILEVVGPDTPKPVLLHGPSLAGNELKYVGNCIESGWVSTAGNFVSEFEQKLARLATGITATAASTECYL